MNNLREYNYLDQVAARQLGPEAINEVSLSRLWQHFTRRGEIPFGILSAYKGPEQGETCQQFERRLPQLSKRNRAATLDLERDIRSHVLDENPLGPIHMKGTWEYECRDEETGDTRALTIREESFFVPKMPRDLLLDLGKKYEQEGVIYGGPGDEGGVVQGITPATGEVWASFTKFRPVDVAKLYSEIRGGRRFIFEWNGGPGSWMMAVAAHAAGKDPVALRLRANRIIEELRAQFDPTVAIR